MVFSVASHKEEGSSSNPTPTIPVFDLPEEIVETIGDLTFEKRANLCYKTFLTILLKNHGLAVNNDESVMYHAPYCFIHDWYKVNPSSRRCERKLPTLYADIRSLMARVNGVDPDKIPYYVMWNISVWSKDHPDAYKWIEANGQWLYDNFDHCDVETSDDDDDARSLWSSDDDEHFNPFEDDPTHPDARWSPVKAEHLRAVSGYMIPEFPKGLPAYSRIALLIQGIHMITPTDQEPDQKVKQIWWDVCNCESFLDEAAKIDDDEDLPKKRKSSQQKLQKCIINELRFKIQELHREIIQIIRTFPITQPSSFIYQKEAEMKNLKNQLQDLERQHKQKRITSLIDDPWRLPSTPFVGVSFDPQPLPRSYTHTTSPSLNIWASEQRRLKPSTRKEPTFSQESQSIADVVASTKTPDVLPIQKNLLAARVRNTQPMLEKNSSSEAVVFQEKDLKKHYDRMSQRFYCLNGVDDVNLKQVFLNSFLESLRNEAYLSTDPGSLNQVEPVDVFCSRALYSLDDVRPLTQYCAWIAYLNFSSDDDSDTDSLESDSDFGVHMINLIPYVLPIQEDPPLPLAKVHLLTVIAFCRSGSSVSIWNLNILQYHYWKPHHQNFMAANGEKFVIDKISVPINIRLFPKCVIKRRLLGSSSHGKDLLIGFDILHKLPNLRWSGEGLHYRSFFNPWTAMHRLFVASITPPIFNISSISKYYPQKACCDPPIRFSLRTKPAFTLWLNPSFFVSLPFKQNEDVNPTKASHPGMNPDHYQLAKEECEQLVSQGIIEPTTSPWACEAFYVNKRSEQVRGKLRLVLELRMLHQLSKAMITVFEHSSPIQWFTLLIFSCFPRMNKSHAELLSKFYSLVAKYGIMLSEKKMEVGPIYELSSQKMIQQFLGLVNYMVDFLPKLSHHAALLFPMLKKNPPQWTSRQTKVVKAIKCLAEKMPPLKIPASLEKDSARRCRMKISDDDDDARSLWSSYDDEHIDPFEDDPTHSDARWSP
ncbi:hypothetical protein Tco_0318040 [Tanacetum coccineum]